MTDLIDKKIIQDALIEKISRLNAEGEKSIQTAREFIRFKRYVDGITPISQEKHQLSEEIPTNAPTDLISRQDAIEAVAQQWLFEAQAESPYVNDDDIGEYRSLAEELFTDIPSADRPMVRCRDCKHWNSKTDLTYCDRTVWFGTDANDYCSFAERTDE